MASVDRLYNACWVAFGGPACEWRNCLSDGDITVGLMSGIMRTPHRVSGRNEQRICSAIYKH